MAKKQFPTVVVKGTLYWTKLTMAAVERDNYAEKFVVDVGDLSDEDVAKLEHAGLAVKTCDKEGEFNKGRYLSPKSNIKPEEFRKGDNDFYFFEVVDTMKERIDPDTISNGSKALIKIEAYPWVFGKKTGIRPDLKRIVVTDHIVYESPNNHDDMDELIDGAT
jgi:hypothetical protein